MPTSSDTNDTDGEKQSGDDGTIVIVSKAVIKGYEEPKDLLCWNCSCGLVRHMHMEEQEGPSESGESWKPSTKGDVDKERSYWAILCSAPGMPPDHILAHKITACNRFIPYSTTVEMYADSQTHSSKDENPETLTDGSGSDLP